MSQAHAAVVRHQIVVEAPIARAFTVFTERFGDFKPPEHNLLAVPIAETVFEPHVGGQIYDRGVDGKHLMLIAPGYSVTRYTFSAPFGTGNTFLYGHDDIEGNIFGHLYDLRPGDTVQIDVGGETQGYRVTGHQIVPPTAVGVMDPTPDVRLTIMTCWPFNVDTKRWIVTAVKA